jgi:hypothetical protein
MSNVKLDKNDNANEIALMLMSRIVAFKEYVRFEWRY